MDVMTTFWDEELRAYPHGGSASRVWVVRGGRCDGAALTLLLDHGWRQDGAAAVPAAPPLGLLWRAAAEGEPGERSWRADGRAWRLEAVPVPGDGGPAGALALCCAEEEPWLTAVRDWSRRLAARLAPVLGSLGPAPGGGGPLEDARRQPSLFDWPVAPGPRPAACAAVALPRPAAVPGIPDVVGVSREIAECCRAVQAVAGSNVNVLLHGESGTGKEILARAVHRLGPRRSRGFIGVNCAALPETLFESELFGHQAGAFTGAGKEKSGLLEAADGGTFFLDEIGDMPLALQIKLLRVMQERKLRRLGELRSRAVDVRFIAASHKDLAGEIAAGRFRLDLYFRLKVVQIAIPPLRHRPEDVAHLLSHVLQRRGADPARLAVAPDALAALQAYRWPGNVRELENEAQRWLALHPGAEVIELDQLSAEIRQAAGRSVDPADLATLRPMDEATELLERYLIRKAICACDGRKSTAARRLGLSRQGLYKKIRRYGMGDLLHAAG
ncbi:MAG: sigma 54-interacting transcriptional regulator [bacterium]|nr:sigma 54-interacting transcriptional regulator [bacterium]